jgi:peroxiredoxin Q/BCP
MTNELPKVGKKAPHFSLNDQDGKKHELKDYAGSWLLIYFYPKDHTPGCTAEACAVRDIFPSFGKMDAKVLGVSPDSEAKHKKFKADYNLPFPLLADVDKKMVAAYGVWQTKKFLGKEYMGVLRTSFLISPEGKIAKVYEKVKPLTHASEVVADLKKFTA